MPRLKVAAPKYSFHKASKQAVVYLGGQCHYLGPWKTRPRHALLVPIARTGEDRVAGVFVAGLNPHCGEGGLFGDEDDTQIAPAVEAACAEGIDAHGPIPADTVFHRAYEGGFDLIVAQYHDQGHIPIKLVAFDTAVNVSLGLPIDRCSVDHGTAFDIAGKGIAKNVNLDHALAYARRMAATRRPT